jgi:hypothetical protein
MPAPRFRLRSLVLLIVFFAMVLAIVTLTLENHRLQRIAAVERQVSEAALLRARADLQLAEAQARQVHEALIDAVAKQATRGK